MAQLQHDAQEIINRARKIGPRYTLVRPFDTLSEDYTRIMADIGSSMEFRWMLLMIREKAVSNLIDKPIDGAAVNIGMVMAVEEISSRLNEYVAMNKAANAQGAAGG